MLKLPKLKQQIIDGQLVGLLVNLTSCFFFPGFYPLSISLALVSNQHTYTKFVTTLLKCFSSTASVATSFSWLQFHLVFLFCHLVCLFLFLFSCPFCIFSFIRFKGLLIPMPAFCFALHLCLSFLKLHQHFSLYISTLLENILIKKDIQERDYQVY